MRFSQLVYILAQFSYYKTIQFLASMSSRGGICFIMERFFSVHKNTWLLVDFQWILLSNMSKDHKYQLTSAPKIANISFILHNYGKCSEKNLISEIGNFLKKIHFFSSKTDTTFEQIYKSTRNYKVNFLKTTFDNVP